MFDDCPCCNPDKKKHHAGSYKMCDRCFWEDDGQFNDDADEIRGGPNDDYSLTEARENYRQYGVMYRPGDPMFEKAQEWKKKYESYS